MGDWVILTEIALLVVLAAIVVPVVGLFARRRWLSSRGRVFDCALRRGPHPRGSGWMLGTARYSANRLSWYRTYSLAIRPRVELGRDEIEVVRVHPATAHEKRDLLPDSIVVDLGGRHGGTQIAMDRDHLTAFLSWAEAAAPGGGLRGA
ncbi:DUF2550 domain-containing protein [Propioniciclava soli]|uniref:DUF2550 domain-containing protein n=1 Tax=Propioniciclava soli TaxID=2775081 RepID=A0ABZ3C319_9ACTN